MKTRKKALLTRGVAARVRHRIEVEGERLWRIEDFEGLSPIAVAKALSRLARAGLIKRLSKGVYFRPRETAFGESRANPSEIQRLASKRSVFFPSGVAAANLLGFTTQHPARRELATTAQSLPKKLVGEGTVVHARRPKIWATLREKDAALLDLLRRGGSTSELSGNETIERTLAVLGDDRCYERLVGVAATEPPRVRALLGALGELLGRPTSFIEPLRESLNPLSRFSFGVFDKLPNARDWQGKMAGP